MNKIDLKDKIAVITGGAQGFGYAIAKRFISSDAKVIILDKDPAAITEAIDLKEIKFNDTFETDITNYNGQLSNIVIMEPTISIVEILDVSNAHNKIVDSLVDFFGFFAFAFSAIFNV